MIRGNGLFPHVRVPMQECPALPRAFVRLIIGCILVLLCSCTHASGGSPGRAPSDAGRVTPAPSTAQWQYTDPSFAALAGARAISGRLGNALYEIEVPDNWNGEVVMYAHGFAGSQPFL